MLDCSKRGTELGSKRRPADIRMKQNMHPACISGKVKDSPALRVGSQLKAVWLGGHCSALGTALGASVHHLTLSTEQMDEVRIGIVPFIRW